MNDTSNELPVSTAWAYALEIYAQPGVADACLHLQDRLDVDVIVLLYAMFCAHQGLATPGDDGLLRMDSLVEPWRRQVVLPLRNLRRSMRLSPVGAPDDLTSAVREAVKRSEVMAEQVAFHLLEKSGEILYGGETHQSDVALMPTRVARFYAARRDPSLSMLDAPDTLMALKRLGQVLQTKAAIAVVR